MDADCGLDFLRGLGFLSREQGAGGPVYSLGLRGDTASLLCPLLIQGHKGRPGVKARGPPSHPLGEVCQRVVVRHAFEMRNIGTITFEKSLLVCGGSGTCL